MVNPFENVFCVPREVTAHLHFAKEAMLLKHLKHISRFPLRR